MSPGGLMQDVATAIAVLVQSGDPVAVRVAEGLTVWARSRTITLEQALGYAPGLRAVVHQRHRDDALRRLARRFLGLSGRAMAEEVHLAVSRYETSSWPRDRAHGHRPDGRAGDCYDVLSAGDLPGREHLRRAVLVGCRGAFDPHRTRQDPTPEQKAEQKGLNAQQTVAERGV
jgi:hypothetical protein